MVYDIINQKDNHISADRTFFANECAGDKKQPAYELQARTEGNMRYALIGCGRIAPNHIVAAVKNSLDIVAVCDLVPQRMEDVLKQTPESIRGTVRRYTNYAQMLHDMKPELVAIATESGKHAAIALDCIAAGCHVIIEKPIALSLDDADRIISLAREQDVLVCANHQNRFNRSVQKIREALDAGRFGNLLYGTAHVRWNRGPQYYEQAPWRGTWAQDGGALMNQSIHNIDLLRWMMGDEVEEVFAYTDNMMHDFIEAEDLGLAVIKFANGSYGMIEGTTNIFPHNLEETLYLFGHDGTVKAGGKSVNIIEEWLFKDKRDDADHVKETYRENPPSVYGFGHTPLYADMVSAILDGRQPYVTGEDGRRALELVLAIYLSASEHRPIKFPLNHCSTLDFTGRFTR